MMGLSKKAQTALSAVLERFQVGDLSPIVEVSRIKRAPGDEMPSDRWSFGNRVLAWAQTGTLDCRGYNQWKEVGRQVKKGSSAAWILGPITVKKETDDGEEVKLVGFKGIPVHPVDNTEGDKLPKFDYKPAEMPPLTEVAEQFAISFDWTPLPPDRLGQVSSDGENILVGTHDVKTWFHELAHAIDARLRGNLAGKSDADKEAVAEFTATVLMWLYGYGDRTGNCYKYIEIFSPKDPLRAIMKAVGKAEAILAAIERPEAIMK